MGARSVDGEEFPAVDGLEGADVPVKRTARGRPAGRQAVEPKKGVVGVGGQRGRNGGLYAVGCRVVDLVHEQDQCSDEERDQAEQARQRGEWGRGQRVSRRDVLCRRRGVVGGDSRAGGMASRAK